MATFTFTINEALNVLLANDMVPAGIRDVKPDRDGLLVTVAGGIAISVRPESFAEGVLRLAIGSKSWAFRMADSLGKVDEMIDEAIRNLPFIHRENKILEVDLNEALQSRVKGVRVKDFALRGDAIQIGFLG